MSVVQNSQDAAGESFDLIAHDLLALKGVTSYGALVRLIAEVRVSRGVQPGAAIPARSTVYDVMRPGRTRMDSGLVKDIVLALGADEAEAERWVDRCARAHASHPARQAPQGETTALLASSTALPRLQAELRERSFVALAPVPTMLLLLGCVSLNVLGNVFVRLFGLPVYLDMVGTAVAAIALGPWYGAAVAVGTNLSGTPYGDHDFLFAFVGVAGALVWGYGVTLCAAAQNLLRFCALNLVVAAVCTLVAAPILLLAHGGANGAGQAHMTGSLVEAGIPLVGAVFSTNIVTSVLDKLLTGFLALLTFVLLYSRAGIRFPGVPFVAGLGHTELALSPASPART
ncbi:energy-coupling factor transport system substrate-specific component [Leucobacter luti]|uniref:hypothetical protein n=1 Tax=Leucobacter luti TaxID=340320 RepID=UPI00104A5AC2|nr:hypothetical protein [Leucobacter luti]MCW2289732.1 energy-coupling factor transport system substrate-specific component [Leucobacter luti]TCK34268.1 energy-coupling factor transport system substrate-specific component [Leucobacter luti]